ncbi:MAG: phosphoenolpyruvate carboxylase [Candidatus Kariarchaeaceae archaeon]|jgi:phosphoenolpyruvate carboxylase
MSFDPPAVSIDPHTLLSPTIKLLGDILGEVITEQAGPECLNLVEEIRSLSKSFREENNLDAVLKLRQIISGLNPKERIVIIRSFSIFFQLINLAEEDFRINVNQIHEFAEHDEREDTLSYAIAYGKKKGLNLDNLYKILSQIQFQLVYTAHPTEARRLTNLIKLREIFTLIRRLKTQKEGSLIWSRTRNEIKERTTILWQSDDLRENKVEILDEVRTNLFYFENTVFEVVPQIFSNLQLIINDNYQTEETEDNIPKVPSFLSFGSWVGGDRDGHPHVTSDITIQTLLLHKRLCIRKYLTAINQLLRELSSSLNQVNISDELKQSLNLDQTIFPQFASSTKRLNRLEPYRRKLDFIRLKLENTLSHVEKTAVDVGLGQTLVGFRGPQLPSDTSQNHYKRSKEFQNELLIIEQSLRENKGSIIAEGKLSTLLRQVETFGFHLAPLDLRQDSTIHLEALSEIFSYIGAEEPIIPDLKNRSLIIRDQLVNPRPLGTESMKDKLTTMTQEVLSTLQVAKLSQKKISPRSIGTYIISMTTHESDVYAIMLLMKEIGLIDINGEKVTNAALDIAPLFETKEDLENAPKIMYQLLSDPLYRSLLLKRGDIQEIMIGYSDSTKDIGVLSSNYKLIIAQKELVTVANQFNIELRIFHGRGGSISRGGGPTNKSILSQPLGTLFKMKITEQGEVIGSNYSNPHIAYRHLEQIISAVITRAIVDSTVKPSENPANPPEMLLQAFEVLALSAQKTYEELVKEDQAFIPFYLEITPLDLIERATIGSRPSRRASANVKDIKSLRAIPWTFSWMQSRLLFPGFYGVGTALDQFVKDYGIDKLQEHYSNWSYFQSLVNNLQMVGLKADMNIAYLYLQLVEDKDLGNQLFERIKKEYHSMKTIILKLTSSTELLDNSPTIQTSIIRRNPYIDPLNLIQLELLKQWRNLGKPEDLSETGLQRALLLTLNGIAAGLRNTG